MKHCLATSSIDNLAASTQKHKELPKTTPGGDRLGREIRKSSTISGAKARVETSQGASLISLSPLISLLQIRLVEGSGSAEIEGRSTVRLAELAPSPIKSPERLITSSLSESVGSAKG
jgi:hypothetical protein